MKGIRLLSRTLVIAIVGAKETSLLFFFLRPSSLLSPVKTAISRLREEAGGARSREGEASRRKLNQNFRLGAAKRAEMYIKAAVLKT